MKWGEDHNTWMAKKVVLLWRDNKSISFNAKDEILLKEIENTLNNVIVLEKEIENEVQALLDQLEKTEQQGSFDRRRMYGLLKQKIAEKKGVAL